MPGEVEKSYSKFPKYQAYEGGYNPRVHGPYLTWKDYRKTPRISIWDMKLGNIWPHFLNSNRSPSHIRLVISKSFWRMMAPRYLPRRTSFKPVMQLCFLTGMLCLFLRLEEYAAERRVKYHW